jgi:hypothetical protein
MRTDANDLPLPGSFADNPLDLISCHPAQGRQQFPLIRVRLQIVVHEYGVVVPTRHPLERQRDQVAKATPRHRVLIREEPVVRVQAQVMAPFHRSCQDGASHFASENRRQRRLKEDPHMATVPRLGTLKICGHTESAASGDKSQCILLSGLLVEVDGQQPAGLIHEKRVNPHGLLAGQVQSNDFIGQRQVPACLAIDGLAALL